MDTMQLHKAVMAYGESMRLMGVFSERFRTQTFSPEWEKRYNLLQRAGAVSTQIHARIIKSSGNAFTPPF